MDAPPLTADALESLLHERARPPSEWRIGAEFERFALRPDGRPLPWAGGIRTLLERFADRAGWTPVREAGEPVALEGPGGARIALEPGGQVEISASPCADAARLAAQERAVRHGLAEVADALGARLVAAGYTPFARLSDAPWVPKSRYRVLRAFLRGRGPGGLAMMRGTCAVQVHVDHGDEADCARKVALAAGMAPLLLALTARSPLRRGRPTGHVSWRAVTWRGTDPDRTGFPPPLLGPWSHRAWVEWLLDRPAVFRRVDGVHRAAGGLPFRAWMAGAADGPLPTIEDWRLHESAVFPEVRVRGTIEIRSADAVDPALALAVAALAEGLAYDPVALDEALDLLGDLAARAPLPDLLARAARSGPRAEAGRPFRSWIQDLVAIGRRGLARVRPGDLALLAPAEARAEAGRCPADDLLDAWRRDPSPGALLPDLSA